MNKCVSSANVYQNLVKFGKFPCPCIMGTIKAVWLNYLLCNNFDPIALSFGLGSCFDQYFDINLALTNTLCRI